MSVIKKTATNKSTNQSKNSDINNLITDNIDVWTSAIKKRNSQGRGSNKKIELTGIKKLRELILELAVRGKLIPQDANDEPASVLLEKIAEEKAQLITDKKIKKQKPFPTIPDKDKPFELPSGWEFERLGNLTSRLGSGSTPRGGKSAYVESGIIFLRSQNVWNDGLKLDDTAYITDETHHKMVNTHVFPHDVLLNITGASLGRSTIFPENLVTANVSQHVTVIRLLEQSMCNFLHLGIMSPLVQKLVWGRQVGMAIEGLSKKVLEQFEFPVPPLAEQQRIVAKVDELMVLCDQLEHQTEESLSAHQTLVEVLLATLMPSTSKSAEGSVTESKSAVTSPESFQTSWQRIAEHFDLLFTTEQSIEQLKQTILQLAVMGKLVPQNPSDEPASVLLEKIAEEKAQLIADKKIKKQKPLPEITDKEQPFELPKAWEWCYLENTALTSEAGWSPRCLPTARENEKWGVLKVSAVTWGVFNPDENKELPSSLDPRPQYEVHSGDFLISRANTAELVARAVIVPTDAPKKLMMSDKIIRFVLSPRVEGAYISLVNNSRFSRTYYAEVAGGTSSSMKNVSREHIRSLVIALPPITEQNRIITKVDELMALCEQLKARLSDAQTTQLHLADAIVENAIN
ncbi:MAG: restriction endonuclease subunit S [Colwellia sp.]|nr:restriction endonuclease subunit S [Colwellia sp.]